MPATPSNSCLKRSDSLMFWLVCKYLIINLYLWSHLQSADANQENHLCSDEFLMKCKNGECVSKAFVCDGENDCGDFTDEENCPDIFDPQDKTKSRGCNEDSFHCLDGLCIPNHWVCDGSTDCMDNSDETNGCNNTVQCDDGFRCNNRFCIPKDFMCDGDDDCGDDSDEENCPTYDPSTCNINNKQFLCNDRKKCLRLEQDVCNGINQCFDGSDEGGLCLEPKNCKPACINGHECIRTPLKSLCVCPAGHIEQMGVCKDVDECQEFGACDHKCVNTIGNFSCSCLNGYILQDDRKTCKADGGEGLLVFSSEHEIRAFYLESKVYYPISNNITQANGIAYDGHYVYWSDVGEGRESIVRSNEDGSDIKTIVDFGLGNAENIALDWITGNIYFTDSQKQHIGVCDKTGDNCMVLHKDGLDNPRALALDPNNGWLFWSDWGETVHSIIKSGMDGSERKDFVTTDIFWPNGITIDFGTGRLYWADAHKKRIESILLDGSDRKIIVTEPVDHPFSIAVFENKLYWSDWRGNQILTCNKFNGKHQTAIIKKHDSQIYNLYIFHSSIQSKSTPNPCLLNKCSHLCLLSPETSKNQRSQCACPQDMQLSSDQITCQMKNNVNAIYVAAGNTVTKIKYEKIGKHNFEEHVLDNVAVLGDIAYDSYSDSIIISDLFKHRITSFNRQTKQQSILFESDSGFFFKMDHDPIANNLYWIDANTNSLNVMSLDRMETAVLIPSFGEDIPKDFELVPEMGIMFVSLYNKNGQNHIDKYFMDGSSRYHFIEKGLIGPMVSLKYDDQLHRLFYADQGAGQIASTSVDILDKHVFREHLPGPIGLTVHGDYLFWVNFGSDEVLWANKLTSEIINFKTVIARKVDMMHLISLKTYNITNNTTCHVNNGGCSHLCLLRDKSQVCTCPTGMILDRFGNSCVTKIICGDNQYTCGSGECISKAMLCNKVEDCQSGDDENNCFFSTEAPRPQPHREPACPLDYFFCLDNSGCLPQSKVCNGYNDCADSSDELHCSVDRTCGSAHFTCTSGECIPSTWRCDDRVDCQDFSDENDCKGNTCNPDTEFRCNSGSCIPLAWECDSELDCPDASDEHINCEKKDHCKNDMFMCMNRKCVDKKLACNGFDDCGDSSDEVGCDTEIASLLDKSIESSLDYKSIHMCNATHFTCYGLSKSCLPLSKRCDGKSDCTYSEDEADCNECIYGHFECKKIKECIPEVWVCDGMPDCSDKSDEDDTICMHKENNQQHKNETVPCIGMECKDSKQCIPFYKVCDSIPDCKDHSDEMGLCGTGCDGAGCSQICRESPVGAQCHCSEGYKLAADGRSCIDVNECSSPTACSQTCHNTIGSFFCTCLTPYYLLRDDRRRCKATGKEMELIYQTERDIRLTTESLSTVQVLYQFKGPTVVDGMDLHVSKGLLYWTSKNEGKISKLTMEKPSSVEVREGFDKVGSIAVDWITGNIYVVVNNNILQLCDSNLLVRFNIYRAETNTKITAVALDPINGWVFWSEAQDGLGQSVTTLKKSLMTGKMVENLLKDQRSIVSVSDLSFDVVNKWLYFSDFLGKTIGRVYYNGTKFEVLFMVTEPPSNVGLFEDHIYLTVKSSKQSLSSKSTKYGVIEKCGIESNLYGECTYIRLVPSSSKDVVKRLRISHQSLQIEGKNYCEQVRCEGVCVINGNSAGVCLCHEGTFALEDGSCPKIGRMAEEMAKAPRNHSTNGRKHTTVILFISLTLLILCAILVAIKYDKLVIPHDIYARASSQIKRVKSFKFKRYDNSSFQFDSLKNQLSEQLIPEADQHNHQIIRDF